jgi:hypothetical protein
LAPLARALLRLADARRRAESGPDLQLVAAAVRRERDAEDREPTEPAGRAAQ